MKRLDPSSITILIVDIQEKLAAAMPESAMTSVKRSASILLEAAEAMNLPVLATEQYPAGLGPTLSDIRARLVARSTPILDKVEFSAVEAKGFSSEWDKRASRSAVVIGMETHVCVYQTVRELVARGVDVHVPIDGVASRRDDHRQTGLDLCKAAGGTLTTTETVVFDLLRAAKGDAFKRISKAVR